MPCCGGKDDPTTFDSEDDMSDSRPAVNVADDPLVPLYTHVPTMRVQIAHYGFAENYSPCYVPESVAVELQTDNRLGRTPYEPLGPEDPEENEKPKKRKGKD